MGIWRTGALSTRTAKLSSRSQSQQSIAQAGVCLEEVEVAHFAGGTLSAEDFKKGFFFGGRPCGKVWDEGGEHGEVVKGSCGGVDRVRLEGCSRIWRGDTEDLRESPGRGVAEVLEVAAEVAGHQAGGTEAKVSGGEAIPGAGQGGGGWLRECGIWGRGQCVAPRAE